MEIHSSSLAFIPSGYTRNNNSNEEHVLSKNKKTLPAEQPGKRVDNNFKAEDIKLLSNKIEEQEKTVINTRITRALNAYTQENTQALKNQRTELVSGIDFFA